MESLEREEEEAGAKITVKKKKTAKGKSSFRQTKLASGGEKNSLEVTKPSPFAETIEPSIPEFNANPKKPGGGRKRAKAEPKEEAGASSSKDSDDKEGEGGGTVTKKAKVEPPVEVLEGEESKVREAKPVPKAKSKATTKWQMSDDSEVEIADGSDDTDVRSIKIYTEIMLQKCDKLLPYSRKYWRLDPKLPNFILCQFFWLCGI